MDLPIIQFETPSTCVICGPTATGKTTFVKRLLENATDMFKEPPSSILYCYGSIWQAVFDEMTKSVENITFHKGLPSNEELLEIHSSDKTHFICIIDDCMGQFTNSTFMEELACVGSHHLNMTIIFLMQNLFQK